MPHTLYRIKVCKEKGLWCCCTGTVTIKYPLWTEAQKAADSIARKWRSHYSGWY